MVEPKTEEKKVKFRKITNSKFISFLRTITAGILLATSATLHESFREAAIGTMLVAAFLFIWEIYRQARSTLDAEIRIDDLERRIGDLERQYSNQEKN